MGKRGNKIALCARSVMESVTRKMSACKERVQIDWSDGQIFETMHGNIFSGGTIVFDGISIVLPQLVHYH